MSRVPVRVRLTAAFAVAMALVLVGAGAFVYERLRNDLDESVTAGLLVRGNAVVAAGSPAAGAAGEPEEGFAQVLAPDGRVVGAAGRIRANVLRAAELRRVRSGERSLAERRVPGIEGTARVLARAGRGAQIVVVGQSLQDRDDTLDSLVRSFAVGGPIAILLASLLGYALAAAGLRPVEAMRRRAREVSLSRADERLPLPAARDEIRRLGETLNEMLDRLSRSFERERRFVADASHELRTPVAVIKAELEGALRAGGHAPQVREALVASVEECDHLAQLAEDLLILARSSEGQLPVQPEPLALHEQLERVARRFGDRAAERGRGISVDAGDELSVYADELRLRQALGNLVDNALRYGRGEIVLRARRAGPGLALEVADEGEGFAAGFAERAFERFARDELTRTREGAGLGLSIVRAIAEAHDGHAEVVGGAGATVRIWLPDDPGGRSGLLRGDLEPAPAGADLGAIALGDGQVAHQREDAAEEDVARPRRP
jgi:signal transduction histidine kinase